jgi:hypothetical protein
MGAGTKPDLTPEQHLQCGKSLFNFTWTLLEKPNRSDDEAELMVHAAHASAYHWRQVGEPKNFARSDWQLARVYAMCRRGEPAMHHAKRCLALCNEHGIAGFDLAFAHEAIARAALVEGDAAQAEQHIALAERVAKTIEDQEDRELLLADVKSLKEGTTQ